MKSSIGKSALSFLSMCLLASCTSQTEQEREDFMKENAGNYTAYIKSRMSDKILKISVPKCFYHNYQRLEGAGSEELWTTVKFSYPMKAFSNTDFSVSPECQIDNTLSVTIYSFSPDFYHGDKYAYLMDSAIGKIPKSENKYVSVYKTGVVNDGVFYHKDYPRIKRPLQINFIAYDEGSSNSPFRYFFDIYTVIYDEFELQYVVSATRKDSKQYAEKFRRIIEENKDIKDYPDILDDFMKNNESVAKFFEQHSEVVNQISN